jgi:hypothetical protein
MMVEDLMENGVISLGLLGKRLGEISDILARPEKLNGDRQRSVIWFRFQPISSLDNYPPADLVAAGHYACVLEHLEDLAEGIHA